VIRLTSINSYVFIPFYYFYLQFILEPVEVEKEGDLPVLIDPLLAAVRQERYTFVQDMYIWKYPLSYENTATLVRIHVITLQYFSLFLIFTVCFNLIVNESKSLNRPRIHSRY